MGTLFVDELRLQNFRAFAKARLSLEDLTFLVGKNGAGKSSLMYAFELLRDAVTDSLTNAIDRQGHLYGVCHRAAHRNLAKQSSGRSPTWRPAGDLGLAVSLRQRQATDCVKYSFRLRVSEDEEAPLLVYDEALHSPPGLGASFRRTQRLFTSSLSGLAPSPPSDALLLPLIAGMDPLWQDVLTTLRGLRTYDLSPAAIGKEQSISPGNYLAKDGSNAAEVLHQLQKKDRPLGHGEIDWLLKHLRRVLPGLAHVGSITKSDSGTRLIHFIQQSSDEQRHVFRNGQVSNGTLRALGILLALIQQPVPSLVFIDELEDSLHVDALAALVDAAEACTSRSQVIVTSHSPELLGHLAVTAKRLRILGWRDGVSNIYLPSPETQRLLAPPNGETAGFLLRSHALWPDEQPQSFQGDLSDELA